MNHSSILFHLWWRRFKAVNVVIREATAEVDVVEAVRVDVLGRIGSSEGCNPCPPCSRHCARPRGGGGGGVWGVEAGLYESLAAVACNHRLQLPGRKRVHVTSLTGYEQHYLGSCQCRQLVGLHTACRHCTNTAQSLHSGRCWHLHGLLSMLGPTVSLVIKSLLLKSLFFAHNCFPVHCRSKILSRALIIIIYYC